MTTEAWWVLIIFLLIAPKPKRRLPPPLRLPAVLDKTVDWMLVAAMLAGIWVAFAVAVHLIGVAAWGR